MACCSSVCYADKAMRHRELTAIIGAYNAIASAVGGHMDNLLECLVVFNMPFTFLKGMISVGITFLIYKHISPIIKGTNSRKN